MNCSSVTALDFTELRTIGLRALKGCIALSTLRAPQLASITQNAFDRCSALDGFVMGSAPPALQAGNPVFLDIPARTITFRVPAASLEAYREWDAANDYEFGGARITRIFTALDQGL